MPMVHRFKGDTDCSVEDCEMPAEYSVDGMMTLVVSCGECLADAVQIWYSLAGTNYGVEL